MTILVSIATMSSRETLRECLRSIPAAAAGLPVATVVIDNVSTDGTAAMVAAEFPAVELVSNRVAQGFAANHNQAIERALQRDDVEYVLVLNDDAVLHARAIANLAAAAGSDPNTGAVAPLVKGRDGREQPVAFAGSRGIASAFASTLLSWPRPHVAADDAEWLSGCCLLIPIAAIRSVGGFDERFFMYSEDVDLSLRMRAAGYRLWQTQDAVITHVGQATTGRAEFATHMSRQLARSAYQLALKHRGRRTAELESAAVRAALGLRGASDLTRARIARSPERRSIGCSRLDIAAYAPRHPVYADRERPTELLPPPDPRDVVIGMAEGYAPDQISPFLTSLRRTGYDGTIALLMSASSLAHRRLAREHEADIVSLDRLLPTSALLQRCARSVTFRLARRGVRAVPSYMWLPRLVDAASTGASGRLRLRALAVANTYPVALARYAYYLAYLQQRAPTAKRVLLSDVRDVLFQRDPFAALAPVAGLHVFLEDRRVPLGQCPYNVQWLESAYGARAVAELRDRPIVCSGVTLGDGAAVVAYLREMLAELCRLRSVEGGTDQSCHNVLVHRNRIRAVRHANEDGPVYTMGQVTSADLRWDDRSRLVTQDGTPYAILHQYDRHVGHGLDLGADGASVTPRRAQVYTRQ